jgi:hypothetical protein
MLRALRLRRSLRVPDRLPDLPPDPDDPRAGVREPRRPRPSAPSASAVLELPPPETF